MFIVGHKGPLFGPEGTDASARMRTEKEEWYKVWLAQSVRTLHIILTSQKIEKI